MRRRSLGDEPGAARMLGEAWPARATGGYVRRSLPAWPAWPTVEAAEAVIPYLRSDDPVCAPVHWTPCGT